MKKNYTQSIFDESQFKCSSTCRHRIVRCSCIAHVGGQRPPISRKKEKRRKINMAAPPCAGKNADIMPVIIIIIGDRPPDRAARPHPIFIQMCLRFLFFFIFPNIFSGFPLVKRLQGQFRGLVSITALRITSRINC